MSPEDCVASNNPSRSSDGKWIIYDRGSFNPDGSATWAIDLKGNKHQRLFRGYVLDTANEKASNTASVTRLG